MEMDPALLKELEKIADLHAPAMSHESIVEIFTRVREYMDGVFTPDSLKRNRILLDQRRRIEEHREDPGWILAFLRSFYTAVLEENNRAKREPSPPSATPRGRNRNDRRRIGE